MFYPDDNIYTTNEEKNIRLSEILTGIIGDAAVHEIRRVEDGTRNGWEVS
ncbi:hypothetical protein ONV78_04925 [Hahella sp. CR1]|nr:hypothetical protein [Hahella sp. CR1]MDG9667071.1 hypothetical protein [Hahella sp. CR1]